jgi:rhamnulokinase
VLEALKIPTRILPGLVPVGTKLGALRPDLAKETKIEDELLVLAACSHELAAAVAGLPVSPGQNWAFMRPGDYTLIGTEVPKPVIHEISRELGFSNVAAYGGGTVFYKRTTGLWLLEQCQRFWQATDRSLDWDLLVHLAGSATPFESLINPSDPRFLVPGDMPLKIQAFCRETDQPVPRKPGAVFRCILESLALLHRRSLGELEYLAGIKADYLFIIGDGADSLFHHFIANALGVPVVVAPADPAAVGNVVVQALTLGHLKTLDEGREMIRRSLRFNTIVPQSTAWESAFNRFMELAPSDRIRAEQSEAAAVQDRPAN